MNTPKGNALIIFARNPVAGQVKTRLAQTMGHQRALQVYKRLLGHTASVAAAVTCTRYVYCTGGPAEAAYWPPPLFAGRQQSGLHLGGRMLHSFTAVLANHERAVIIGTDCYELRPAHIEAAFEKLLSADVVMGPAADGGYYLLGMNRLHPQLFEGIEWSSPRVAAQTLHQIKTLRLGAALLECLNDVDTEADVRRYADL